MSDIKWIKIATDIFDDEKMLLIESMPDSDALIVIWLKLLVLAGKCNSAGCLVMNDMMPYTEEMLSAIFRRPLNTIRLAISTFEQYGMVEIMNDVITIPKWEKHQAIDGMEKVRKQTRERVRKHREKQKLLTAGESISKRKNAERVDLTDKLSADEIQKLYSHFEDAGQLIDEVEAEINLKDKKVDKYYPFIVGYARNKGWGTK